MKKLIFTIIGISLICMSCMPKDLLLYRGNTGDVVTDENQRKNSCPTLLEINVIKKVLAQAEYVKLTSALVDSLAPYFQQGIETKGTAQYFSKSRDPFISIAITVVHHDSISLAGCYCKKRDPFLWHSKTIWIGDL